MVKEIINFINELDCVKLIKSFKNLKVGTKGVIVLKYNEIDYVARSYNDLYYIQVSL